MDFNSMFSLFYLYVKQNFHWVSWVALWYISHWLEMVFRNYTEASCFVGGTSDGEIHAFRRRQEKIRRKL